MAAESASNNDNVPLSNGNVPTPAPPSMTPTKPTLGTPEGLLTTIVLTIYDVIVFLAISIGYIFEVSCSFLYTSNLECYFYSARTQFLDLVIKTFIRMDSHTR